MNIFKRELVTNFRNPIFIFISGIGVLLSSISLDRDFFDIKSLYSIYPYFFLVITPLLASGIWLRDKKLGISTIFKLSKLQLKKLIGGKILAQFLLNGIFLFLFIPIPLVAYGFTTFDFGQLITIHLGILLLIYFLICTSFFLSTLVNSRIFVSVITTVIGLFIWNSRGIYSTFFDGYLSIGVHFLYLGISMLLFYLGLSIIDKKAKIIDIVSALFIVVLSFFMSSGFDFTLSGSYRTSKFTKELLENSNTQIEFYYTGLNRDSRFLVDKTFILLNKFKDINGVSVVTVPSGTEDFDRAISVYGIDRNIEDNNFIVIRLKDHYHVIPSLVNYAFLEFEIDKVVTYLINEGLPKVGLYIGNENLSEDSFNILNGNLSEDFNTQFLYPGDSISLDLDALIIIGTMDINEYYSHEIGHYIAGGGNVLFGVNGLDISNNLQTRDNPILNSLRSLGVYPEPYLVADSRNVESFQLNVVSTPVRDSGFDSITKPFTGFTGFYTSPIAIGNDLFKPVLSSSQLSWLVDSSTGIDGLPETSFTIGAYGEGEFGEYFDDHIHGHYTNRIFVLGSNLSFTDYPNTLDLNGNYDFVKRVVYKLIGGEDLINVRNRNITESSYYKLENNLYSGSILNIYKIFSLVLYPIIIFGMSFIVYKKS